MQHRFEIPGDANLKVNQIKRGNMDGNELIEKICFNPGNGYIRQNSEIIEIGCIGRPKKRKGFRYEFRISMSIL